MTTLDSLPADQRAVLSLLLRQGRTYEDIGATLRISEAALRERAHGALATLGPDTGLSARRRAEIGDWLLLQGPDDERAETEGFLVRSDAGRAWAAAVADALRPIGGDEVPRVPGVLDEEDEQDEASAAAEPTAGVAEASATAAADEPAPAAAGPRVSRRGGAIVLAVAVLAIAGGAIALLSGGDDNQSADRAASTSTTKARTDPSVVAQVNLKPPSDAPAPSALGILQVIKQDQQQAILVRAQNLPKLPDKNTGYGVWLSSSPDKRIWLGYGNYDAAKRQFVATGVVATDVTAYGEVFITRETGEGPKEPGTVYLRGAIQS
jgi:Sigma-70, region 4